MYFFLCKIRADLWWSSVLQKTQQQSSGYFPMRFCRNCTSYDACNKPGYGHVLGNIPLEPDGNNGENTKMRMLEMKIKDWIDFPSLSADA